MPVIRYTLRPESPWTTPLRSDTLHGLLLCAIAEHEGSDAVTQILTASHETQSMPFTCSSAFPQGFLPMPCLPGTERSRLYKEYAQDILATLQEYKVFLKKRFIPYDLLLQERKALSLHKLFTLYMENTTAWTHAALEKSIVHREPHNTIHRTAHTTIEGGLFFPKVLFHHEDMAYHVYIETQKHEKIRTLLTYIGEVGFGGDASTGKGRFSLQGEEDVSTLFASESTYTHSVSLGVLAGMDMTSLQGYYQLFTKKGRTWSQKSAVSPFKKPFLALQEGAVLHTLPQETLLQNIHVDASVVQVCHTLRLPCSLMEHSYE